MLSLQSITCQQCAVSSQPRLVLFQHLRLWLRLQTGQLSADNEDHGKLSGLLQKEVKSLSIILEKAHRNIRVSPCFYDNRRYTTDHTQFCFLHFGIFKNKIFYVIFFISSEESGKDTDHLMEMVGMEPWHWVSDKSDK